MAADTMAITFFPTGPALINIKYMVLTCLSLSNYYTRYTNKLEQTHKTTNIGNKTWRQYIPAVDQILPASYTVAQ